MRSFAVDIEPSLHGEVVDGVSLPIFYEEVFGIRPQVALALSAFSNRDEDHQILGELALILAETLKGIIDLGPVLIGAVVSFEEFMQAPWPVLQARVDASIAAMPGKAVAVPCSVPGGRTWASHTVDLAFLRAWLTHPKFRMGK